VPFPAERAPGVAEDEVPFVDAPAERPMIEAFRILHANSLSDDVARLIRPEATLLLPSDETLRPHPSLLLFHREPVFKG